MSRTITQPPADFDERVDGPPDRLADSRPISTDDAPPEAAPDDSEAPEDDQEDSPGKEAAKYRRKLRAAEKERDTLAETVTAMRRAEVERLASGQVMNPAALWSAGVELGDLLGEDGTPDEAKVRAAVGEAATRLGLARPVGSNHVAREGTNPRADSSKGWAELIGGVS